MGTRRFKEIDATPNLINLFVLNVIIVVEPSGQWIYDRLEYYKLKLVNPLFFGLSK